MTQSPQTTWLTASRQKLAHLARTIEEWTPKTLYGAVAGMTLLPLAATSDDPRTVLAGLVGADAADLLANQLEAWKERSDNKEQTLADQLMDNARTNDDLRAALDTLLEKVEALQVLKTPVTMPACCWNGDRASMALSTSPLWNIWPPSAPPTWPSKQ